MPRRLVLGLASFLLAAIAVGPAATANERCSPSWKGKYTGYVLKMYVPEDLRQYGRCNDYGVWKGTAYKGRTVPSGSYWVYAYPYWYVWRVRGYRIQHRGSRVYRIGLPVQTAPKP